MNIERLFCRVKEKGDACGANERASNEVLSLRDSEYQRKKARKAG